jgi:HAD superfamily hydrolase (TIGR01509 family)
MSAGGILFDFNGVIADDEVLHFETLAAVLHGHGITLSRDQYNAELMALTDQERFRQVFERAGLPTDRQILLYAVEQKAELYEDRARRELGLVRGVRSFIEAATAAGMTLGVGSNALRREVEFVLQMKTLRDHFDTIVSGDEVERCKPDPLTFERARMRLRLDREHCVVIEHSPAGIAAARAAGFRCIAIASSLPAGSLQHADQVWADFSGRFPADLPWTDA